MKREVEAAPSITSDLPDDLTEFCEFVSGGEPPTLEDILQSIESCTYVARLIHLGYHRFNEDLLVRIPYYLSRIRDPSQEIKAREAFFLLLARSHLNEEGKIHIRNHSACRLQVGRCLAILRYAPDMGDWTTWDRYEQWVRQGSWGTVDWNSVPLVCEYTTSTFSYEFTPHWDILHSERVTEKCVFFSHKGSKYRFSKTGLTDAYFESRDMKRFRIRPLSKEEEG